MTLSYIQVDSTLRQVFHQHPDNDGNPPYPDRFGLVMNAGDTPVRVKTDAGLDRNLAPGEYLHFLSFTSVLVQAAGSSVGRLVLVTSERSIPLWTIGF